MDDFTISIDVLRQYYRRLEEKALRAQVNYYRVTPENESEKDTAWEVYGKALDERHYFMKFLGLLGLEVYVEVVKKEGEDND